MFRVALLLASIACGFGGGVSYAETPDAITGARVAAMNGCLNVTERGQSIDQLFEASELEASDVPASLHSEAAQSWVFRTETGRIQIVQQNDPAMSCSVLAFEVVPAEIADDLEDFISGEGAPFRLLRTEKSGALLTKHFGWERGEIDIGATLTYADNFAAVDASVALKLIFSLYRTRIEQ